MNVDELRKELVKRVPEVERLQRNPDHDPEINASNYAIYKKVESDIMDFVDEIITKLFEL